MSQPHSRSDRPGVKDNGVPNACRTSGKPKSNAKNFKKRRQALIRKMIFGPPPILENEDSAEYELLLERQYTDVKPKDIAEESWVHDGAYWDWEVRRWRRMRICVIEAATPAAMSWVLGGPRSQRLKFIGELNDLDVDVKKSAPDSSDKQPPPLLSEEASAIRLDELKNDFKLISDTITTRKFLEEFDLLERIDRMIAFAESRRNAAYREIHRHRAARNYSEREKTRMIDDAEFKVIKTGKTSR